MLSDVWFMAFTPNTGCCSCILKEFHNGFFERLKTYKYKFADQLKFTLDKRGMEKCVAGLIIMMMTITHPLLDIIIIYVK